MRDQVWAIDPGGTTGWACWSPDGGLLNVGQSEFDQFVTMTHVGWQAGMPGIVVCERYTVTAETLRKSRQTTALEVIGWLRGLCVVGKSEFILQQPGDAKRFATDARLNFAGWRQRTKLDHANDALRHLLLFLVKTGRMEVPRAVG